MYKTSQTDQFLSENIQNQKESLQLTFLKNFETQEKTLELLVNGINHAKFNEFEDTKFIWNIAAFINIISFDFKIVGQDLMFAENEWQKRYYARQACLIIYESINDFFDLLGKDFRKLITANICDEIIENELKSIRKELNSFKANNFEKLKEIRNHYQPTKTKNLSILFLYYSYSNVYDIVISFLKPYLPSKKGHLCGCRALVAANPALGVCPPALSYYPH